MTDELRRTPLHARHVALGARLSDFGGWEMPIEYSGVVSEHAAVRERAGVFDVSHMGKVRVSGEGALAFLNSVLANDLDRIGDGQAQYSLLCDESGGVIDDLIVYRWSPSEFLIVPNASNAQALVATITDSAPADVNVENLHAQLGIIAVQGPASAAVLGRVGLPTHHDYMSVVSSTYAGVEIAVCRSGYTGELGFEIVAPVEVIPSLWDDLLERGADLGLVPAGLGARDTLRTEMGYPLHGHELSRSITPLQARLAWAIGWDKPVFHGRAELMRERAEGPRRVLRGIRAVERAIPRPQMSVQAISGENVGEVTSGTFSPTLKCGIGIALLAPHLGVGDHVIVDVRGRPSEFEIVQVPFVESHTRP